MANNRIYIASDHNGNAARAYVIKCLQNLNYNVIDCGPTEAQGKVDYPDFAQAVCHHVVNSFTFGAFGILICGTGTGMSIAANKIDGIRAGIATDRATAELMREHNNCNVLVLGQWRNSLSQMDEIVNAFLTTNFAGGRHDSRLKKLQDIEKNQ
jgi:ribose 5-phosphate isomerase B